MYLKIYNLFGYLNVYSQVVHGMSALQEKGFCCPNLEGKDIFKENNCISAKIWHFCICTGCTGGNCNFSFIVHQSTNFIDFV